MTPIERGAAALREMDRADANQGIATSEEIDAGLISAGTPGG